jgi:hypothetical protein
LLRPWLAFPTGYASTRRCGLAPRPTTCRRRRTPESSTRGSRCGWCRAVGRTIRANSRSRSWASLRGALRALGAVFELLLPHEGGRKNALDPIAVTRALQGASGRVEMWRGGGRPGVSDCARRRLRKRSKSIVTYGRSVSKIVNPNSHLYKDSRDRTGVLRRFSRTSPREGWVAYGCCDRVSYIIRSGRIHFSLPRQLKGVLKLCNSNKCILPMTIVT